MTRFSESEDSETIYYVTQLVAALYFMEHLEASNLSIDPTEFQQKFANKSENSLDATFDFAAGTIVTPQVRALLRKSVEQHTLLQNQRAHANSYPAMKE